MVIICLLSKLIHCSELLAYIKHPTTKPVIHDARVAPIRALKDTAIKSPFLSGYIALIPETNIPTDEKFAKPHSP